MDTSKDTIHSALAELDHLVEAALSELAEDEWRDGMPELGDDPDSDRDPTVSEILDAAARLREVTEVERLEAPALADRLEGHPEARARLLIDNQTQCQTWGLCEELLARVRQATFSGDSDRAVRIARLATMVSERLDDDLLDRIDEVVAPGTVVGTVDRVSYHPPAITQVVLRRRPVPGRAAA